MYCFFLFWYKSRRWLTLHSSVRKLKSKNGENMIFFFTFPDLICILDVFICSFFFLHFWGFYFEFFKGYFCRYWHIFCSNFWAYFWDIFVDFGLFFSIFRIVFYFFYILYGLFENILGFNFNFSDYCIIIFLGYTKTFFERTPR